MTLSPLSKKRIAHGVDLRRLCKASALKWRFQPCWHQFLQNPALNMFTTSRRLPSALFATRARHLLHPPLVGFPNFSGVRAFSDSRDERQRETDRERKRIIHISYLSLAPPLPQSEATETTKTCSLSGVYVWGVIPPWLWPSTQKLRDFVFATWQERSAHVCTAITLDWFVFEQPFLEKFPLWRPIKSLF